MDGAVVRRQEDGNAPALRLTQEREQPRPLEPLPRDLAEGDLVARHLEQNRGLAASVRQQIHEVEDECADALGRKRAGEPPDQIVGVRGRRDLLVADGVRLSRLGQLCLEQLPFVRVERLVLAIAPPIREARRDLAGKESAEEGIARVRSRGRQNREIVRGLDLEHGCEERHQDSPLVEAEAVDDDEHRRALALENRQQELADDINRQRRPIAFEIAQPPWVLAANVRREITPHVREHPLERLVQSHLADLRELDVPIDELTVPIDPAAPVEGVIALVLKCAEPFDELSCHRLLPDLRALEDARHDGEDLPRIDRLDEIVIDVDADRLAHRRIFLALRDHHDRKRGIEIAQLAKRFESTLARHLLIEQHQAVRSPAQHLDRVVGVGRRVDVVSFVTQEDAVRFEQVRFVIHPQNAL
jgi:hypothetical protein